MTTDETCGGGGGSFVGKGAFCGGSGGGCGGPGGGGGMYGVREYSPPPFLIKLFNMVSDPKTKSIIAWSKSGDSFIISDHLKFSAELLGVYFNHNNFSSFIYQLNNYGFRKCGVEHQWEYINPYFQKGRQDLLTMIKRRDNKPGRTIIRRRRRTYSASTSSPAPPPPPPGDANAVEKTRLEILGHETAASKLEIDMLKQKHKKMESKLEAALAKVKKSEKQSEKLETFLVKALRKQNRAEIANGDSGKKAKHDQTPVGGRGSLDVNREDVLEEEMVQKEGTVRVSDDDSASLVEKEERNVDGKEKAGDYEYWEQMMMGDDDDEEVYETDEGTFEKRKPQDVVAAELLELIATREGAENAILVDECMRVWALHFAVRGNVKA